jgi:hypothetical protein
VDAGRFFRLLLARQLAVVVMLQASVLTLLGPRVGVALAFPLFYMLFLVPAGDEMIPTLQTVTARITMLLLSVAEAPPRSTACSSPPRAATSKWPKPVRA